MKTHHLMRSVLVISLGAFLLVIIGCAKTKVEKIPITTTSESAREFYLQGRDLFERLQAQESRQYFEKAVAEDPNFAMGYLFLSFAQHTNKGFFENLEKAVELVENASHPVVFGDELMNYLNQVVQTYQSHVHPGEVALGVFPVAPAPPQPPLPPPTPALNSTKVKAG